MVRNYVKTLSSYRRGKNYNPYNSYSEENLQKALDDIRKKKLNIREAAEKYKVPKSTLGRQKLGQNSQQERPGRPTLLTDDEEDSFIQHLNLVASWGFPFDLLDLRLFIKGYLDRKGVQERRLKNNMPGKDGLVKKGNELSQTP